jgi:hypothetical protein
MAGFDAQQLVGHFLLHEDADGYVDVSEFRDEDELVAEFDARESQYNDWAH